MTTPPLDDKSQTPLSPTFTVDGVQVFQADALTALSSLPPDSIDAICTDPPYGLSKEPDIAEVLEHWLAGDDYVHHGKGFMGNSWDSFVPGPAIWREAFRVLKPGGYAVVFASTRTFDLMVIALRMAGFQVIDTLAWAQAQGFPKSLDIERALTKAGHSDLAAQFHDHGTALKPGFEPIALVRKPLIGTYAENVATHGTGALNIGGCRVQNTTGDGSRDGEKSAERRYTKTGGTNFAAKPGPRGGSPKGRYPSNVILTHHPDCLDPDLEPAPEEAAAASAQCADGCPILELDTQSGVRTSGKPGTYRGTPNRSATYGAESRKAGEAMTGYGDSGGASRFYPTFRYTQKANSRERATVWLPSEACVQAGHAASPHDPSTHWEQAASSDERSCGECGTPWVAYQHPTVKPPAIMEWLCRLVGPNNGVILDLFAGTGSTGVAATREGMSSVLIERDPAHVAMIHKRLANSVQTTLFGAA